MTIIFPEGFKPGVTNDRDVFKSGIRVTDVGRGKIALHLGAGVGGRNVEFHRKNPPKVVGEYPFRRIFEANIMEVKGGEDFILTGPTEDEVQGGILLCIQTKWQPKAADGATGFWRRPNGLEAQPLPKGWGRRDCEGGTSAWWHGLVLMQKGNVLFVSYEGGEEIAIWNEPRHGLRTITLAKANYLIKNTDTADIVLPEPVELVDPCPAPPENLNSPLSERELAEQATQTAE